MELGSFSVEEYPELVCTVGTADATAGAPLDIVDETALSTGDDGCDVATKRVDDVLVHQWQRRSPAITARYCGRCGA